MELDLIVAGELSDRIQEQTDKAKDGKRAVAKRDQMRAKRMTGAELGNELDKFLEG